MIFHRAIKKYGIDAFDFKILAIFDRVDAACYHEQAAILKFKTLIPNGYNCTSGAPFTQYPGPISDTTRRKIGNSSKGRKASVVTRQKISEALKGNQNFLGQHRPDDVRKKISQTMLGKHNFLGQHHSIKTRRKMAKRMKGNQYALGHHPSENVRRKMSVANKAWWANKKNDALS
jgi:group I intron endonuclease